MSEIRGADPGAYKFRAPRSMSLPDDESLKVQKLVSQLQLAFRREQGVSLKDAISGDITQASAAHAYLFQRALQESDPALRRILHLAHLKLELQHNTSHRLASAHGTAIGKSGKPKAETMPLEFSYDQMITSGDELAKTSQGEKLLIETEKVADVIVEFCEQYLKVYEAITTESRIGPSKEQRALIGASYSIAEKYFGNPIESLKATLDATYQQKRVMPLHEFKNTGHARCTEYAALIQQFLSFAGQESRLFSGAVSFQEGDEYSFPGQHVFLIIQKAKESGGYDHFLYDPVNPIDYPDEKDPTRMVRELYVVKLDDSQAKSFEEGNMMNLSHPKGQDRTYSRT